MTSLEWKYIDKVNREGQIEGCKWLFLPTWHKSKGEWMKVKVKKEKFLPVDARWCNWCIWSQLIHSKWLLLTMESLLWKVPARTDFLGQWATNQNNSKNRKWKRENLNCPMILVVRLMSTLCPSKSNLNLWQRVSPKLKFILSRQNYHFCFRHEYREEHFQYMLDKHISTKLSRP